MITLEQLYRWNPSLASGCKLITGTSYCVEENYGIPPPEPTTSSTTRAPSATTADNGITTPTPTQSGMVGNCRKFYKVVANDNCDKIVSKTGASKANIIKWNAQVGSSCNVWLDYYICVGV